MTPTLSVKLAVDVRCAEILAFVSRMSELLTIFVITDLYL